jgi:hypothetical protein
MAKKILLGLLILAAVAGVACAQGTGKMAVSLDLFPLAKGMIWSESDSDSDSDKSLFALVPGFEYLVSPHYTVGAVADLYFGEYSKNDVFYFGLAAHGRWYPQSTGLDKLFIDAGLGFNMLSVEGEKADRDHYGFTGLTMSLKLGYKLMLNKFFIEPSMAFVYAKTPVSQISDFPTPIGWQPGLSIGAAF